MSRWSRWTKSDEGRFVREERGQTATQRARVRRTPRVERLESRCLLATTVTIAEFAISTPFLSAPIAAGPDGGVWFATNEAATIERIDPTTHAVSSFPVDPYDYIAGIATGPDRALWFTGAHAHIVDYGFVGRFDPTTHTTSFIDINGFYVYPSGIAAGPDGGVWFTKNSFFTAIGRIDPTTHAVSSFNVAMGADNTSLLGIAAGPDGGMWFTENGANKIGRIDPTTHAISEFAIPTADSHPAYITAGADGALWFTEQTGNKIGRIDPTTHAFSEFTIPTPGSRPDGIVKGPDGALWFTESSGNKIGRLDPTTHAFAEFTVPTAQSNPAGITTGPDGGLWFTETTSKRIGEVILAPAPRVEGLARYGVHWQPTKIVLTFDQAMSASSVESTSNYVIATNPHYHNRVVRIVSATYNAATHRVTLVPATRLNIHYHYTLVVNGHSPSGVESSKGVFLDGAGTGTSGTDYVKRFGRESLVLPARPTGASFRPKPIVSTLSSRSVQIRRR